MFLLEVAMCRKCRSSNFQSEEGESKKFEYCREEGEGIEKFLDWGWVTNLGGGGGTFAGRSVHHYCITDINIIVKY